MKEKVVIQIVTYNAINKVHRCLNSLKWVEEEANVKIVVLDNASSEPIKELIKDEFPFINFIANSFNTGFAKGHNAALKCSLEYNPDFLLILNPDTTVDKISLSKMVEKFSADSSIGLVGPLIKNDKGEIERSINVQLSIWNYIFKIFAVDIAAIKTKNKYLQNNFVDAVTGACMLVNKETINAVGLFDEDFFFYVEDTEFCNRIIKSGRKILFTPDAVITHSLSGSTSSHKDEHNWRKTQLYLSTFVYFKKCKGSLQTKLLKLIRIMEMRFRILFGIKKEWARQMLVEIANFKF